MKQVPSALLGCLLIALLAVGVFSEVQEFAAVSDENPLHQVSTPPPETPEAPRKSSPPPAASPLPKATPGRSPTVAAAAPVATPVATPAPNLPDPSSRPSAVPTAAAPDPLLTPSEPATGAVVRGGTHLADLLPAGTTLSDPARRAKVVAQLRAAEQQEKTEALAKAGKAGLPTRIERPDGSVMELVRFEGDQPVYIQTHNASASLSTAATVVRAAPYSVDGAAVTVGVWDGGAVLSTHQEFGSRVTVKDGASGLDHSTHVGGTIAASGVVASAKGMATAAKIESYEWNSDKSEMTARGAAYPGESGTIYLSNHSYGYVGGWTYTGYTTPKWNWYGSGTTSSGVEDDFGKYDTNARDTDSLAASLPYYLMFRSAGNDRKDTPATGDSVSLSTSVSSASAVSYNPASHPAGDGAYKGGYDSLGFDAVAKNIVTVGAVSDAVTNGARDISKAKVLSFSSWGPTDDGRIKPDLVANGDSLYSALSTGNSAYGTMSGTSMSSPNATGTAALLVSFFDKLFPGQAMRASTLKALLIATADDLGTAGPDYQYGWGLINAQAAADLVQVYRNSPGTQRLIEDRVTTSVTTRSYSFTWNGSGPIRATLCWTDPAIAATTSNDLRTARLVNNLDLKLTGPSGTVYQPYVMPFVGDWSTAKLSAAATTGKNNTDNVEQVYLAAPSAAGIYTATVSFDGTLTSGAQVFSLILDGGAASASASAPVANSVSPTSGSSGTAVLTVSGANFRLGASVKLKKSGQTDVAATGHEVVNDALTCRVALAGLASGAWDVVVTNPDGQSATLPAAFTISGSIWNEDFESDVSDWTQGASIGAASTWTLSTGASHSTTHAVFASASRSRGVGDLYSPAIDIPAGASGLRLTFWQYYGFQSARDGGVLEFSLDGGTTWFDVTASGSGASFATGGYNTTLTASGPGNTANPLAGRRAWSGSTSGFTQVALDLTDTAKYAGKSLKVRWRLATDATSNIGGNGGWYLDDVVIAGTTGPVNLAPSIASAAEANPETVMAKTAVLTVEAADDGGESALTYTWAATGEYYKLVQFSDNGHNSSKTTMATFAKAGVYTISVTVRDVQNLGATSAVEVEVQQTASGLAVSPERAFVGRGSMQQFTGAQVDQFDDAMETQPAISWTVSGGGTIDGNGLFTAALTDGGPYTVTATDPDNRRATASLEVWQVSRVLAGKYLALLGNELGIAGRLSLNVAAGGTVSGTILTSEGTLAFRGKLDAAGGLTLTLKSAKLGTVVIALQGGRNADDLAIFEGSVTIDGVAYTLDATAQLATAELAGLAPGRFSVVLLPDSTAADSPQGYGWATAVLGRTGALRLAGNLADGVALSLTSYVHRDGEVPIYLPAKTFTSGVTGMLHLGVTENPALSGSLAWEKYPAASGYYAAGFTAALSVTGERYTVPDVTDTILDYAVLPAAELQLSIGDLDADAGIALTGAPIEKRFTFTLGGTGLARLQPAAFNRSTGVFRGTFILDAEPRVTRSYSGILLQSANEGRGFFRGSTEAGRVEYLPNP